MEQSSVEMMQEPIVDNASTVKEMETTIDFRRIFRMIWCYIWVVAIATVVCGLGAFGYTKLFVEKRYASSFSFLVKNTAAAGALQSDEYAGLAIKPLVTSYDTLSYMSERVGGDIQVSADELKGMISATVDSESDAIIVVAVSHNNPKVAYEVAKTLHTELKDYVSMWSENKQEIRMYDSPRESYNPVSPNVLKNTIVGAAIGFVMSCIVLAVIELMNNNIYDDEYLIETYNVPVLANIPDFESNQRSGKNRYYRYGYGTRK